MYGRPARCRSVSEPGQQTVSVAQASLTCTCPRCGKGKLFFGLLAIAPRCAVCDLDFSGFDTGDSFAVPILIVLGAIVVVAAFWVDFHFTPPLWVHVVIWPPVTAVLAVVMTRYFKSFFAAQQYKTRRAEMQL
jgi:uncharacterized protein (DUF983 family)